MDDDRMKLGCSKTVVTSSYLSASNKFYLKHLVISVISLWCVCLTYLYGGR